MYLYVVRKSWEDPLEFSYVQTQHIPDSLSTPTTKLLRISQASSFLVPHGGATGYYSCLYYIIYFLSSL